jgi:hypothetical protein
MYLVLFAIVAIFTVPVVVSWCRKEKKSLDRIEYGVGESVFFDGFKIIERDGSMNQYLAPEVIQAYQTYIQR